MGLHTFASRLAACLLLLLPVLAAAGPPKRIISTAPSITEILFALGLGDRVVGVTQYCRYPKEVSRVPRIGSWTTTNMEVVIAARPDLIVVQRTAVHDSTKFGALGLKTLEVRMERIAEILDAIRLIGDAAGVSSRAAALTASIRRGLDAVKASVASRPPVPVLFVVGRNPGTLEGIIAAAGNSYLSEVIELAGGRNIFADSRLGFSRVVQEEILARNPEVIIDMGEHADAEGITPEQQRAEIALWSRYGSLRAVRNGRVHIVASEVFVVPGPRVVELARRLAVILHPEVRR